MNIAILSIGDELVLGLTVDTNSAWIAEQLNPTGHRTVLHMTIEDDLGYIRKAIEYAIEAAEVVLITGGLGPTEDDLTRFALAEAMGVECEENAEALAEVQARFDRIKRKMSKSNKIQAMIPKGAELLRNAHGTAPGMKAEIKGVPVYVMPGVPREMKNMFTTYVLPEILKKDEGSAGKVIRTHKVNTYGLGESRVGEMLGTLMMRARNPRVGTTVAGGYVSVRIQTQGEGSDAAEKMERETVAKVRDALGDIVFSEGDVSLAEVVIEMLKERGKRCVTAESCTGGLIGKMLTDVAGSSAAYDGGWVTYTNEMKHQQLGVSDVLLVKYGAVSEEVAKAMVEGALVNSDADYSLAVTGIAGPDGGTEEKPVGLVWFGLGVRGESGNEIKTWNYVLHGNREEIRLRTALTSLNQLRMAMLDTK